MNRVMLLSLLLVVSGCLREGGTGTGDEAPAGVSLPANIVLDVSFSAVYEDEDFPKPGFSGGSGVMPFMKAVADPKLCVDAVYVTLSDGSWKKVDPSAVGNKVTIKEGGVHYGEAEFNDELMIERVGMKFSQECGFTAKHYDIENYNDVCEVSLQFKSLTYDVDYESGELVIESKALLSKIIDLCDADVSPPSSWEGSQNDGQQPTF